MNDPDRRAGPRLADARSTIATQVAVYEPGHPEYDDARARYPTLATMRTRIGGDEGRLVDPAFGLNRWICLKQWAYADPDRTHVRITFRFIPPAYKGFAVKHDPGIPDGGESPAYRQ